MKKTLIVIGLFCAVNVNADGLFGAALKPNPSITLFGQKLTWPIPSLCVGGKAGVLPDAKVSPSLAAPALRSPIDCIPSEPVVASNNPKRDPKPPPPVEALALASFCAIAVCRSISRTAGSIAPWYMSI